MKKTKYDSFLLGKLPEGCEMCVRGKKMVLFVTGLCSRGCEFCPLSKLRKNIDKIYSNERPVNFMKDLIEEVKVSNATGCSLTGGDPLLKLKRTIKLGKALKKKFGRKFHIHIYLSTKLVNKENLKKISEFVDEVRFHPDFEKSVDEEIKKIRLGKIFWKKKNLGIEIPMFPDKVDKIYEFTKKVYPDISFINLNELEAGEIFGPLMEKKYKLSSDGYTVKNSVSAGKKLIKLIEKDKLKLNVHLCTANLKIGFQYKNRLKNYQNQKFSHKTNDGTRVYFSTKIKNKKYFNKKDFFIDKGKLQIIINPEKIPKIKNRLEIYRIEEYPTYDREEILKEKIL